MNSELALDPATLSFPIAAVSVLFIVLVILWILLPFAVFGVKKRLDEALRIQREQLLVMAETADAVNALVSEVNRQLEPPGPQSAPSPRPHNTPRQRP